MNGCDLEMSEKKVVSRKLAIVLGIICIILAAGLVGVIANYTLIISGKDKTITSLNAQIINLENQITSKDNTIASLNSQINQLKDLLTKTQTWLQGNITYYKSQIADLQNQISSLNAGITSLQNTIETLKAPQLHEVNFKWEFHEPWIGGYYVHVSGAVFNSGTYTAKNVRINVWLYDSNYVLIKSYTINLGDISGKTYSNFAEDIGYSRHCAYYSYEIVHD